MDGASKIGMNEDALPGLAGPLRRAVEAFTAGRLGESEFYCRLVLTADKKQFHALHLLGLIEFQRGRLDEAYSLFRRAVRINPRSAPAHINLASVLQQRDRSNEALASLDRALTLEPNNELALNNRGHLLWRLKRPQEAIANLDRALAIRPGYADALCNRGNVLVDLQRFEEALSDYNQALVINPRDAPAWNNRGNVLWALDRRDEAMQSYDRALALNPDDLSTLKDRGTALLYADRGEEALASFDRALMLMPDDIYFLYKRGSALAKLNRFEEALDCFDQVLTNNPEFVDALDERGNALAALQRAAEAIASFDRALAIAPATAQAHWNRAVTLLRGGDYEQGWQEFEWRWKLPRFAKPRDFTQPLWPGDQTIDGKTVLLHAEQGFGDTIHFVRYVPQVAALGATVIVEVQPELKTLIERIESASCVLGRGEGLPTFDLHCPLLSLPLAFKSRLETIPAKVPYLSAEPERVSAWAGQLPKAGKPHIGVAWAGNPQFQADKTRSIGLANLAALFSLPGLQFVSIQKDLRAGDEEILREHPDVLHLGDRLIDFADTAAIMTQLDLVISSDTAVVHLAGALGRPVWVLLEQMPEWRWMLEREDSPWYPTARLFRQTTAGDWQAVVASVAGELQQLPELPRTTSLPA
jgi:tetratricopeptide (TPR) repeat protein